MPRGLRLAVSALLFLLGISFYYSPGWPYARIHSLTAKPKDPCASALQQQADMLVDHYSTILKNITHVAIVAFPAHSNRGDSAIWSGQKRLLVRLGIKSVYEADCGQVQHYDAQEMRAKLEPYRGHAAILLHGGGNFGDMWSEHRQREQVIQDFLDFPIRSFPQTVFFQHQQNLERSIEILGQHSDLHLAARDAQSLQEMQTHFGKHKSVLLPDMATMLTGEPIPAVENVPIVTYLIHARTDFEGGQQHGDQNSRKLLEEQFTKKTTFSFDDWISTDPANGVNALNDEKAEMRIANAYSFLKQGRVTITDRLHAHILSVIWDLPHVALETGEYKKLQRYHDQWLTACSWPTRTSMLVHDMKEAITAAKQFHGLSA